VLERPKLVVGIVDQMRYITSTATGQEYGGRARPLGEEVQLQHTLQLRAYTRRATFMQHHAPRATGIVGNSGWC
jgi:hypothetical protein